MSVWSMSSYIWHDTVEWTTPTGSKKELDRKSVDDGDTFASAAVYVN